MNTCKATNRQGTPCQRHPAPGATVCNLHGGKAPQVQTAAARRILEQLVGPALTQLARIVNNADTPHAVRLAAIRDILDRTGYKPATQLEVITLDVIEREIARLEAELATLPDDT